MKLNTPPQRKTAYSVIVARIPGPDRKRLPSEYRFRVTYRHPDAAEPGCVMVWEVVGGRLPYQIAVERTERGELKWHCSCADAVYRGENPDHCCKHVRGLIESVETVAPPVPTPRAVAA